jgi:HSP20 family protein
MAEVMKKPVTTPEPRHEAPKAVPARMFDPFVEMDRLFGRLLPSGWIRPFRMEFPAWPEMGALAEGRMPRIDVIDRDKEVLVRAELPGVEKKDLEVTVTDNAVTIRGHTRREAKEEKKGEYYRCETWSGEFARTVALPVEIEGTKGKATFKDGVMELVLPKAQQAARHTIAIE